MWKHANSLVSDNFLDTDDLEYFLGLAKSCDTPEPQTRHVVRQGMVDSIDTDYYCKKYRKRLTDIYSDLNGMSCPKFKVTLCWTVTGDGYVHKPHCDAPHKLLSTVVYLSPEEDAGTYYDEDESVGWHSPQALWKVNRAFSFSAKQGVTWHRFKSLSKKRVTLNFHLTTQTAMKMNMGDQIRKTYL
tara:strand:- start:2464 stop:3021 length:558 start_codon:yes stop_codon:yes gene_type:complete